MNSNELEHYGVKGMKWGVRKKYYTDDMDNDVVIKQGSNIQNISKDKKRSLDNRPMYGSYNTRDNTAYAGSYAKTLQFQGHKPIKNELKIVKDVKIPSQKKSVDLFYDMYTKDPDGVVNSIAKAQSDVMMFNRVEKIRKFNQGRIEKKFLDKGEEWVKNKGYEIFNQSMMSDADTKARTAYYDLLIKKGYSGIRDVNDINNSQIDAPVIFLNPKNTLKNVKSEELSQLDIELYNARHNYDLVSRNTNKVERLLLSEYRDTKKELHKTECNYAITKYREKYPNTKLTDKEIYKMLNKDEF